MCVHWATLASNAHAQLPLPQNVFGSLQVGDKAATNFPTTRSGPSSARRAGKRASSMPWATRPGTTTTILIPTASKGAPHATHCLPLLRCFRAATAASCHGCAQPCGSLLLLFGRGRDVVNMKPVCKTSVKVCANSPHFAIVFIGFPRYSVVLGYTERWHLTKWKVTSF